MAAAVWGYILLDLLSCASADSNTPRSFLQPRVTDPIQETSDGHTCAWKRGYIPVPSDMWRFGSAVRDKEECVEHCKEDCNCVIYHGRGGCWHGTNDVCRTPVHAENATSWYAVCVHPCKKNFHEAASIAQSMSSSSTAKTLESYARNVHKAFQALATPECYPFNTSHNGKQTEAEWLKKATSVKQCYEDGANKFSQLRGKKTFAEERKGAEGDAWEAAVAAIRLCAWEGHEEREKLAVVTFNVLRGEVPGLTSEEAGSYPITLDERAGPMRSFFETYKPQVQVFALQELSSEVEQIVAKELSNFTKYPAANEFATANDRIEDVVYFDHTLYSLVRGDVLDLHSSTGKHLNSFTVVRLRSRHSGRQFIVASIHLKYLDSPEPKEERRVDMEHGDKFLLELFEPGDEPLILAGDLNENQFPLSQALKDLNVRPSFDWLGKARPYTSPTTAEYDFDHDGDQQLDWMLSRNIKVTDTQRLDFSLHGKYPSDHFPIMTTYLL